MIEVLSLALAGAVSGGLYAIMASGLVLTYQSSGIFNLGHGAIAFVSALSFYILHSPTADGGLGLPVWLAGVLAVMRRIPPSDPSSICRPMPTSMNEAPIASSLRTPSPRST